VVPVAPVLVEEPGTVQASEVILYVVETNRRE
jgi:hypothetical protein